MSQQTDSGLELSQTSNALSHAVFLNKYLFFSLLKVSFCLASSPPISCQWTPCIFRSASGYMQYQPGSKTLLCCYFEPKRSCTECQPARGLWGLCSSSTSKKQLRGKLVLSSLWGPVWCTEPQLVLATAAWPELCLAPCGEWGSENSHGLNLPTSRQSLDTCWKSKQLVSPLLCK